MEAGLRIRCDLDRVASLRCADVAGRPLGSRLNPDHFTTPNGVFGSSRKPPRVLIKGYYI